jgi:hypothetical protein
MYYPILLKPQVRPDFPGRVKRNLASVLNMDFRTKMLRAGLTAAFWNSYFFHMGGGSIKDAGLVDTNGQHIWFSFTEANAALVSAVPRNNGKTM